MQVCENAKKKKRAVRVQHKASIQHSCILHALSWSVCDDKTLRTAYILVDALLRYMIIYRKIIGIGVH